MRTSNLLENKVVKFYSNPALHTPKKALIVEDFSAAFNEGRKAWLAGCASSENPYNQDEGNAIWSRYDCWLEGYMSGSRY
jgi:hypothetical protein